MRRILFLLIIFTPLVLCKDALPSLVVDPVYDFGNLQEGRKYDFNLVVKNSGSEIQTIKGITHTCGCISYRGERKTIDVLPGQEVRLDFSFNTTGYQGKTHHGIFLYTTDSRNPVMRIDVFSNVSPRPQEVIDRFQKYFSLGLITTAGLLDGINPCAFTVIVFFVIFLRSCGYMKRSVFYVGISFIAAVFFTYILVGLGLFKLLYTLSFYYTVKALFMVSVGIITVIFGLYSFYDALLFKKTGDPYAIRNRLPKPVKNMIQYLITKGLHPSKKNVVALVGTSFVVGFLVSLLESVCTGQVYLPTLIYVARISSDLKYLAFFYLLVYNICFVIPLFAVFFLGIWGMTSRGFASFINRHMVFIKVGLGCIFVFLGVFLLFYGPSL